VVCNVIKDLLKKGKKEGRGALMTLKKNIRRCALTCSYIEGGDGTEGWPEGGKKALGARKRSIVSKVDKGWLMGGSRWGKKGGINKEN